MRRRARGTTQGFTLIEIMVVIAIIAGLVATVAVIVPQMQERQKRLTCQQRLHDIGGLFMAESMEKPGRPKYDGTPLWLYYRKVHKIQKGAEMNLICPGDQLVIVPETPAQREAYDSVDLSNAPNDMCSFTARSFSVFPLDPESPSVQIIGSDRNGHDGRTPHHRGGVNILFDNGACDFYEKEELGIDPEAKIVVGPESDHEWLKQVVNIPPKKE